MKKIIMIALFGMVAQLIDGSLGMAYGVTSTTLLLWSGMTPAVASASVHLSEVVTTAASGYSHILFKNVDYFIVKKLIVPGAAGAFLGAAFLSHIPSKVIVPYVSLFLFSLGVYVLFRFLVTRKPIKESKTNRRNRMYSPVGFLAGFLDSSGGGGWGPITTPMLLSQKNIPPHIAIGSVALSEFAVSFSSSVGFLLFFGLQTTYWQIVIAMMVGGICAAPIAAWLVRRIKPALLGVSAGGLIMITNLRTILNDFFSLSLLEQPLILILFILLWSIALFCAVRKKENQ
jgi:uncharacterized protein